jgi:hypothetical protein
MPTRKDTAAIARLLYAAIVDARGLCWARSMYLIQGAGGTDVQHGYARSLSWKLCYLQTPIREAILPLPNMDMTGITRLCG